MSQELLKDIDYTKYCLSKVDMIHGISIWIRMPSVVVPT